MTASNEDLMRELRAMREEWGDHILPLVGKIEDLVTMHGDPENTRARIAFVNLLLEREADRKALRKAVIEKTLAGAIWVVLGYFVVMLGHEARDLVISILQRAAK